ncbi:MAG: GAF domain-containing protein [Chloroflexi bacterium]|nr:MAG: GAF domain-containing protein [Chloroflexota bacterium]
MTNDQIYFIILLITSSIISGIVTYFAWQRRLLPGTILFSLIMALATFWPIVTLFHLISDNLSKKLFWLKVEYSFIIFLPMFTLLFAWQYVRNSRKWPWSQFLFLVIHPIVNAYLLWFQPNIPTIWDSVRFITPDSFLVVQFGVWFWLSFLYACISIAASISFFIHFFWQDPSFYRQQILALVIALAGPWTAVLLYVSGLIPFNPVVFLLPLTGIVFYRGFLRPGSSNILPIARSHVVEKLQDGIIVLDAQARIVDINTAAQQMIGWNQAKPIGSYLKDVFPQGQSVIQANQQHSLSNNHLTFEVDGVVRHFDCTFSKLTDTRTEENGRILTLHDVTHRIQQEETLRLYTRRLQFLHDMSQAILHSHEPMEIAQTVLDYLKKMITFQRASFVLFDHDKQEFTILAVADQSGSDLTPGKRLPIQSHPNLLHLAKGEMSHHDTTDLSTTISQHLAKSGIKIAINVPLIAQNELIGAINFGRTEKVLFTDEETAMLQEIASALAAALQQAQLLKKERKQRELAQTLHDINLALNSSLDIQQVLALILEQLEAIVPFDSASVMLRDGDFLNNVSHRTIYQDQPRLKELKISKFPHIQELFLTKRTQVIPNTSKDSRWQSPSITTSIQSWLGIPLIQNNEVIGLLNLSKNESDFYDQEDVETAVIFATQAANAIENARLFASEQQARKTAETLQAANIALTQSLNLDTILSTLLTYLSQLIPYDSVSIMLIDKINKQATLHLGKGYQQHLGTPLPANVQFQIDDMPNVKQIYSTKKSLLITDTHQYNEWVFTPYGKHIRSWIGVPLIAGGEVIGLFSIDKSSPNFFTNEHLLAAETLAGQAAVALQNSRLFKETNSRTAELEALSDLSKALRLAPTINDMLQTTLEMASIIVECEIGTIYLHDPKTGNFVLRYKIPKQANSLPDNNATKSTAAASPQISISMPPPPSKTNIIPIELSNGLQGRQIQLPLQTQNRTVGLMMLTLTHSHHISPNKHRLLNAIADIGGSALHRAIILETLEQRVSERTGALAQANEQLLELDRLKSKFIADVSHELRTPITNLRLYLDLFSKTSPQKQAHYIEVLKQQSLRLGSLVEDILSLSSIEAGTSLALFEKLDLNEIVQRLVLNLAPLIHQGGNKLTLNLDESLPSINGINKHIERAISNLLTNAGNHTENGEVKLCSFYDNDWVYFQISDTGSGIPEEDLPHIFERFYRGQQTGQSTAPGTGLGLAIVKEIALIHHGDIEVESQHNQGAQFTIRFPVA